VTLLLAVANPCLIFPYERLCKDKHPSHDRQKFIEAKKTLDAELRKECGKSCLWSSFSANDWRYKKLDKLSDDFGELGLDRETKPITSKKVQDTLTNLRNALAHGNIWTIGNPIETLVFVSLVSLNQPKGPFNTLQCSPKIFLHFIKNWIDFLRHLSIPTDAFVH